jgi:hypothetical protein
MKERFQEIANLLKETRSAHHAAYSDSDGFDPDWPIWYAQYLIDKLPPLLEANMTKSDLVYLMVHLNNIQPGEAPGGNWSQFYAAYLVQRYLPSVLFG